MLSVALALRHSLIEVASARQALEGQQTKTEMVYQYLTGPRFRHRVEAIVEAFSSMQEDLDREKKSITKQWAKREEQIERSKLEIDPPPVGHLLSETRITLGKALSALHSQGH